MFEKHCTPNNGHKTQGSPQMESVVFVQYHIRKACHPWHNY